MGKPAPAPLPTDEQTAMNIAVDQLRSLDERQAEECRAIIIRELRRRGTSEAEARRLVRALFRQYQAKTGLK